LASRQRLVPVSTTTISTLETVAQAATPSPSDSSHAHPQPTLNSSGWSTSLAPNVPRRGRNRANNQPPRPAIYERSRPANPPFPRPPTSIGIPAESSPTQPSPHP